MQEACLGISGERWCECRSEGGGGVETMENRIKGTTLQGRGLGL